VYATSVYNYRSDKYLHKPTAFCRHPVDFRCPYSSKIRTQAF
jgi:hypothetical protein